MLQTITAPIFLIAFTGHRPKDKIPGRSEAELEATRPLIQEALETFQKEAQKVGGQIHLHCSAAEGADLIACEVAQAFTPPLPLHLILPLPEEEFEKDFLDKNTGRLSPAWSRAKALIDTCRSGTHGNTFRVVSSNLGRPNHTSTDGSDCYSDTNSQMMASADALLAVKNDSPAAAVGGSAHFWNDVVSRQLPRIRINPATALISQPEDLDQLTNPTNERSSLSLLQRLPRESLPSQTKQEQP